MKEEVYERVLYDAVRYANTDNRKPAYFMDSDIFSMPNTTGNLELRYDPHIVEGAIKAAQQHGQETRSTEEVFDVLTVIVRDAVQRSLTEKPELLSILMVTQARNKVPPGEWF